MPVGAVKPVIFAYNVILYAIPPSLSLHYPTLPRPHCHDAMGLIAYTTHTVCQQVVMFISDDHQLAAF